MKKSINDNGSLKNWKLAIENRQLRKMGDVPDFIANIGKSTWMLVRISFLINQPNLKRSSMCSKS